eukprot:1824185-Rhodomonas_salina.1
MGGKGGPIAGEEEGVHGGGCEVHVVRDPAHGRRLRACSRRRMHHRRPALPELPRAQPQLLERPLRGPAPAGVARPHVL